MRIMRPSARHAALCRALVSLTNLIVSSFMIGGITRFCLKIARSQSYGFDDLFCGRATFFLILIAEFLLAIGASLLIVDRGLDPLAAMKERWRMTDRAEGEALLLRAPGAPPVVRGAARVRRRLAGGRSHGVRRARVHLPEARRPADAEDRVIVD